LVNQPTNQPTIHPSNQPSIHPSNQPTIHPSIIQKTEHFVVYRKRLELFPITAQMIGDGADARLTVAGCDLGELAERFGTPLYLYDQATMDNAAEEYRQACRQFFPGDSGVTLAGKAFLCLAAAQWVARQDFWLDCTGAGEISVAVAAGLSRRNLLVHGVNKTQEDLTAAITQAGVIVVDNLSELERLAQLIADSPVTSPEIWLRVKPGVAVDTHAYRQTGQTESKFGLGPTEAAEAVVRSLSWGLPIRGLHFHQGSHFHDSAPIGPALATVLDLVAKIGAQTGWLPQTLSPGGGWGVPYHEDELPHPPLARYVEFVAAALVDGCQKRGLPLPRLQFEPGRSLVARAGVALYRVGAVKVAGDRRWVLIDGGMADNPRPALYGARYSALPVQAPQRSPAGPVWLAGPYCESGDVLIKDLPLPDLSAGELIAVPVSGAYHLMMGSNYNGARKPAVVWLRDGRAQLIQRRETLADLVARDLPLDDGQ
jgi:diaminopimelate decarboxylase